MFLQVDWCGHHGLHRLLADMHTIAATRSTKVRSRHVAEAWQCSATKMCVFTAIDLSEELLFGCRQSV